MKCSNCGAEISNLNLSPGKKQLWFIVPLILLAYFPVMKIFWFKGDPTKDLAVAGVERRMINQTLEITGVVENNSRRLWSDVRIEAELFDADGKFLDEASEELKADVPAKAREHFKITLRAAGPHWSEPGNHKMVVKVVSGYTRNF